MAKLTYLALMSLDGYIADADGKFDWAAPDAEVHAFVNDLERDIGAYLYGRRMYEVMTAWETMEVAGEPQPIRDFAEIWRAADKVVYSRTLDDVPTERTRLEREFEPEAVRALKERASADLGIGGAGIASAAFAAGLVDECLLFVAPVTVGTGTRALPGGLRLDLELLDARRFDSGFVYARYRVER